MADNPPKHQRQTFLDAKPLALMLSELEGESGKTGDVGEVVMGDMGEAVIVMGDIERGVDMDIVEPQCIEGSQDYRGDHPMQPEDISEKQRSRSRSRSRE